MLDLLLHRPVGFAFEPLSWHMETNVFIDSNLET